MKLGILTQPLRNNYGGLMQAWALQKVLTEAGNEVIIINREYRRLKDMNLIRRTASIVKRELSIALGIEKRQPQLSEIQEFYIRKYIIPFIENRYEGISPTLYTEKSFRKYIECANFDGLVVGSDQVWRPRYSPAICNYFLDFLPQISEVKRIAYAASFGVDNWEFSPIETKKSTELAKKFDFIGVRESSGIGLCRKYLDVSAKYVADPTLLLDRNYYDALIDNPSVSLRPSNGELFCYVLDSAKELKDVINACSSSLGYTPYYCNAVRKITNSDDLKYLDECTFPPVEQWLKSFRDAEMVITDSFHGTVFSIIYNKPFWVVVNNSRGATRFHSLLDKFGLTHRIVDSSKKINWLDPIDWQFVNTIRKEFTDFSKALLFSALNEK
ncbi:MAG: polysaccharide pyruvyl transferase family protein [Duncaniella sp.]|uniref:polysaccharide pyruvyl transferase family protein n=1 Tax=Duncaniella sp. TaxID=2518496 RepID=UPI0023CAF4EE|nr:polysaccharide pyruvyl transferase family protein [Duncaniella sp.]MDE6091300.1 polysaccharide pyruvyl transferase family protein [Duncaniella sp.]